jgi:hypothetical protein
MSHPHYRRKNVYLSPSFRELVRARYGNLHKFADAVGISVRTLNRGLKSSARTRDQRQDVSTRLHTIRRATAYRIAATYARRARISQERAFGLLFVEQGADEETTGMSAGSAPPAGDDLGEQDDAP